MVLATISIRRLTACILLATYGSVGVLGYGLHALWHVHHHRGPQGAATGGSSCSCCHHHCCSSGAPRLRSEASGPRVDDTADILMKLDKYQLQLRQHTHNFSQEVSAIQEEIACSKTVIAEEVEGPCPICSMLSQSQSVGVAICSGWLVDAIPTERSVDEVLQPSYLPNEHLARGPPAC